MAKDGKKDQDKAAPPLSTAFFSFLEPSFSRGSFCSVLAIFQGTRYVTVLTVVTLLLLTAARLLRYGQPGAPTIDQNQRLSACPFRPHPNDRDDHCPSCLNLTSVEFLYVVFCSVVLLFCKTWPDYASNMQQKNPEHPAYAANQSMDDQ